MARWKSALLVICGMIAGAVMLAIGTYIWVWFALSDAMN